MDQNALAWIILWVSISQTIEMFILIAVVKKINAKVNSLAPDGKSAGRMIAEAAVEFMTMLQEQSPDGERTRTAVGTFVRSLAITAFDAVGDKVPALKGMAGGGSISDVLPKRYAWIGGLVDLAGPLIGDAVQRNASKTPGSAKKGGVNAIG